MKYIIIVIGVLLLSSCQNVSKDEGNRKDEAGAVYRKISAEEAKDMIDEDVLILDVRELSEYEVNHIPGAILLPVGIIEAGDLTLIPDKDQKLLVYCRSGNRSGSAAKKLVEYGYTNVYDFGGINDWPYEVVK